MTRPVNTYFVFGFGPRFPGVTERPSWRPMAA
jgi:hypothetical protein